MEARKPHELNKEQSVSSTWRVQRQHQRAERARIVLISIVSGYFLLSVLLLVFRPGPQVIFIAYWDMIAVPLQFAGAFLCLSYARSIKGEQGSRWLGWMLVGIAIGIYMIGDCLWTYYEVVLRIETPPVSAADIFYTLFYIPLIAGVVLLIETPSTKSRGHFLIRLFLDASLFAGSAALLSWQYLLRALWNQSDISLLGKLANITYCLGDLAVLVCVIALLYAPESRPRSRPPFIALAFGMLGMAIADSLYWIGLVSESYETGQWLDLGWNAGAALIAIAPLLAMRPRRAVSNHHPGVQTGSPERFIILRIVVTYVLIAAAFLCVVINDMRHDGRVGVAAVFGSLSLMCLIMLRQVLGFEDNLKLNTELLTLNGQLSETNSKLLEAQRKTEQAAIDAQAASEAKSQFLANMSHEIRTPLNGIVGMGSLLKRTALDSEQQRYVRAIRHSADLLLGVISDILDFSKIEAGMVQIEQAYFDVRDVIETTVEMFAAQAHRSGLELITDLSPTLPQSVVGDPHRLQQVLTNLISNAIKFTERGQIVVSCQWQVINEQDGFIQIEVRDSGVGIPVDQQSRLFEEFTQLDASTTRKHGGTGLGLAISKRLVGLMGGTISVESEPGKGSLFRFTVHVSRHAAEARTQQAQKRWGLRGKRVLIVDDNEINQLVLKGCLETWELSVELAATGQEALECLVTADIEDRPFHAAILDHVMPEMDGLELVEAIHNNARIQDLPLILLTSLGRDVSDSQLRAMNIDGWLTKPVRQSALYTMLIDVLTSNANTETVSKDSLYPGTMQPVIHLRRGLRVLLAEDNETNQMVMEALLKNEGLQCDIATDGATALQAVQSGNYALIFMDCQMPVLDGYEATRQIRRWEIKNNRRRTPILALTACATTADRDAYFTAGMDDYITKPVNIDRLLELIHKWIEQTTLTSLSDGYTRPVSAKMPLLPADGTSPAFDFAAICTRCAQNTSLAYDVIERFRQRTPSELTLLGEAVRRGDAKVVAENAHRLKGAAATLSAEPLRATAEALEYAARRGAIAQCLSLFKAVSQAFEDFSRYAVDIARLSETPSFSEQEFVTATQRVSS